MAKTGPTVGSLDELAAAIGVHRRTLIDWNKRGMPGKRGRYSIAEVLRWREATFAKPASDDSEVGQLQKRKLTAEVEQAELKLAKLQRQIVSVEEIELALLPYLATCRVILEQLPQRLLPFLDHPSRFRQLCDDAIQDICRQLSDATGELQTLIDQ